MATVPEFRNEPYADFSQPANRQAMEEALRQVRSEFGREYLLRIGGEYISTGDKLESVNPSRPSEIVGVHHRADAVLAARAIEAAWQYFPEWSRVPAADRIGMTFEAARILRRRKIEFDAWLVYEAGKTWPEAEADVSEAIDFCEYYAREMSRLAGPQPVVQLPGEHDEMIYIPLGVGVVIPPWNFPLAILVGMTVAALVAGNTVVLKPSSETPTIGAKFAEVLLEAGFPRAFSPCSPAAARRWAMCWWSTRRRASFPSPARATWDCTSMNWRPSPSPDRSGSSAWWRKWAARTPSSWMAMRTWRRPWTACWHRRSATRARSARPARGPSSTPKSTTSSWRSWRRRRGHLKVGPADDPANYMGPVISWGAHRTILAYIEVGRQEGRVVVGSSRWPATAISFRPP